MGLVSDSYFDFPSVLILPMELLIWFQRSFGLGWPTLAAELCHAYWGFAGIGTGCVWA